MEVGDVLRPHVGGLNTVATGNPARHSFVLTASRSSQNVVVKGAATDTEWQDGGVISIGAVTTAPTKGTIVVDKQLWKRSQEEMEIDFNYAQTLTGGAAGSGVYLFDIPNGKSIDLTNITASTTITNDTGNTHTLLGSGHFQQNSGQGGTFSVYAYDATRVFFKMHNVNDTTNNGATGYDGGGNPVGSATASLSLSSNVSYKCKFKVPIEGWSVADPIITTEVTNLVENVYSAKIDNSGTASVLSENSHFIQSVNRYATGRVTVTFVPGFFTVAPAVSAATRLPSVQGNFVEVSSVTTTGFVFYTAGHTGTAYDENVSVVVQRQDTDYIAPKGMYLGNIPTTQHRSDGVEYRVYNESMDGKPVYARSYSWTGSTGTSFDLATSVFTSGETILNISALSKDSGGTWRNDFATGVYSAYCEIPSSGNVNFQIGTLTLVDIRVTIKYTK